MEKSSSCLFLEIQKKEKLILLCRTIKNQFSQLNVRRVIKTKIANNKKRSGKNA